MTWNLTAWAATGDHARARVAPVAVDDDAVTFARDWAASFADKITDDDLAACTDDTRATLIAGASAYARTYAGGFDFLRDMRDAVVKWGELSDRQARGVLNCLRSEAARESAGQDAEPPAFFAADGSELPVVFPGVVALLTKGGETLQRPTLRLPLDNGDRLTLTLATRGRTPGAVFVKLGSGYLGKLMPSGEMDRRLGEAPADVIARLAEFEADPAGVAAREGRRVGWCVFCGRELTDPASVAVGYGPICAEKYGLPHGAYDRPAPLCRVCGVRPNDTGDGYCDGCDPAAR